MGVGQGESREETNRHAAVAALAAAVPDPIVSFVMGLFVPPSVADNGIRMAQRTPAKELPGTSRPIKAGLAIIPETWDKRNRSLVQGLSH